MKNKIVFFGTPSFAAKILGYLIDHQVPIAAIVTQPDRPKGRSLQVGASAVKEEALSRLPDIPILQPEKCSNATFLAQMAELGAELFVVVAFGQILPLSLLQIPPLGCINIHASLLPKYRGAAPIQRCLMHGDTESGIAIQKMVRELDAGDVIDEARLPIGSDMTYGELEQALCDLAKPLLLRVLHLYEQGIPPATPQDPKQVTLAPKILPEEGKIHWERDALVIHNLIRALNPKPGAWCFVEINGERKRLKILRAKIADGNLSPKEPSIACGSGALHLLEVQPEGKARMSAADWQRGVPASVKLC